MPTSSAPAVQQEVSNGQTPPSVCHGSGPVTLANDHQLALVGAVNGYRAGSRSGWAPVVLVLMAPALERGLSRLRPVPPAISAEDVRQQLHMEVLEAALCMPLPTNPAVLERAILRRASQAVSRRLSRELRRQQRQEPVGDEDL